MRAMFHASACIIAIKPQIIITQIAMSDGQKPK